MKTDPAKADSYRHSTRPKATPKVSHLFEVPSIDRGVEYRPGQGIVRPKVKTSETLYITPESEDFSDLGDMFDGDDGFDLLNPDNLGNVVEGDIASHNAAIQEAYRIEQSLRDAELAAKKTITVLPRRGIFNCEPGPSIESALIDYLRRR